MLLTNEGDRCKIVFDRQVRDLSLDGQRTQLTAEIYGRFCGKAGNAACMAHYRWDALNGEWLPQDDAPPAMEE